MIIELNKQFIEEISKFKTIYCLISGGWHSTTTALLLNDYNFKNVILVHHNTLLENKNSLNIIKKIQTITNYNLIETKPNLNGETIWDLMKRCFQKIPEVREDVEKKQYDRTKFECCKILKKDPMIQFTKQIDKETSVVILSICPFESWTRNYHLYHLQQKNTYLRLHKKQKNVWFAYPFRDYKSEKGFIEYLTQKGFKNIQHSGCVICPIPLVFKWYKAKNYYNSLKAMARAGMPCFQKLIENYL